MAKKMKKMMNDPYSQSMATMPRAAKAKGTGTARGYRMGRAK